jgi:hypothetical protein
VVPAAYLTGAGPAAVSNPPVTGLVGSIRRPAQGVDQLIFDGAHKPGGRFGNMIGKDWPHSYLPE